MSSFDKVCPRCGGKGLPKNPEPQAPPAPPPAWGQQGNAAPQQQQPVQPQQPAWPQSPRTPSPPVQSPAGWGQAPQGAYPPEIPGYVEPVVDVGYGYPPSRTGIDTFLIIFVLTGLLYCVGFFAPWGSFTIFGFTASFNGGSGLEVFAVIAAVVAIGLAIAEASPANRAEFGPLKCAIAAGCFIFAASEAIYHGFLTVMLQFGFGLGLMVVAGGISTYLAFSRVSQKLLPGLLVATLIGLVAAGGGAAYKGKKVRDSMDPQKILAGFGGPGAGASDDDDAAPKVRDDVDIKVNSTRTAAVLEPTQQFYSNRTPDPGKVYLICNLTVTFKGTSGQLSIGESSIQMTGSDKNVYKGQPFIEELREINPISGDVIPGGSVTGDVVFEVNQAATADKFEFLK